MSASSYIFRMLGKLRVAQGWFCYLRFLVVILKWCAVLAIPFETASRSLDGSPRNAGNSIETVTDRDLHVGHQVKKQVKLYATSKELMITEKRVYFIFMQSYVFDQPCYIFILCYFMNFV